LHKVRVRVKMYRTLILAKTIEGVGAMGGVERRGGLALAWGRERAIVRMFPPPQGNRKGPHPAAHPPLPLPPFRGRFLKQESDEREQRRRSLQEDISPLIQ
jgi:hypothetical protein